MAESHPTQKLTARQHYNRQYRQALTEKRRREGMCISCGKQKVPEGFSTCQECIDKRSRRGKKHRRDKKCSCGRETVDARTARCASCLEGFRAIREKRMAAGLCNCGNQVRPGAKSCEKCYSRTMLRCRTLKLEVMTAYGGKCACCGESLLEALEIDHINNDGAAERRAGLHGHSFYTWLKENNWPSGYQILCASCNKAKSNKHAECPHQARNRQMLTHLSSIPLTY